MARLVQGERPCHQRLEPRFVEASQDGADPRQQFLELERLDQVVVGAQVQALYAIVELVLCRQHDDSEVGPAAQAPADLIAVGSRHHEIQDHDVGLKVRGQGQRFAAVLRLQHLVTLIAKASGQELADEELVIYDEHFHGLLHSCYTGHSSPAISRVQQELVQEFLKAAEET